MTANHVVDSLRDLIARLLENTGKIDDEVNIAVSHVPISEGVDIRPLGA